MSRQEELGKQEGLEDSNLANSMSKAKEEAVLEQSEAKERQKEEVAEEEDVISIPEGLDNQDHEDEYMKAAAEAKKKAEEAREVNLRKTKVKYKKKNSRNVTALVGTKRYNPFAFGSMGSVVSSFSSNFGTSRKDLRKALYADDPLELYLVKGWFKLLFKSKSSGDAETMVDIKREKGRGRLGELFNLSKKPEMQPNGKATLTAGQIKTLNRIARGSMMGELSPEEITKIEQRMDEQKPGEKVGCFSFIKSTFKAIVADREAAKERKATGDTDLSLISPSQVEEELGSGSKKKKKKQKKAKKVKSKAPTLVIGDCVVCQRRVKEEDQLDEALGNKEGDPLHVECVNCELSRTPMSKVEVLRARERGEPCLNEVTKREVREIQEAQRMLHSHGKRPRQNEYLPLFPTGANLFLPVNIVGHNGMPARGMIGMCQDTGLQFRRKEEVKTNEAGERVFALSKLSKKFITERLKADIKVVAAGLDEVIVLNLKGSSAILRKPLQQEYVFKKDIASVQFELRQPLKTCLSLTYHVSNTAEKVQPIKLDQVLVSSLFFSGTLEEDFGPFLKDHQVLKQEKDTRLTGNKVLLEGRYEHGIMYDMQLNLLVNEKENSVSPVSLQLHLRLPKV